MERLNKHLQLAKQAHYNTSFSPEKRGETLITEFNEQLEEDFQTIEKICIEFGTPEKAPGIQETYAIKYERYFLNWLHAKSRCFSVMITGGSNFPVRRHEKANRSEHNKWDEFMEWRTRILKAIKKSFKQTLDPVVEMRKKLEAALSSQEYMKKINKLHAAYSRKKNLEVLENQGLTDSEKNTIINYVPEYSWIKHPFAPYQFTNLNANIKRMEGRLAELESKQVAATTERFEEISFEGGQIILNYEMDRIQIKFPGKPSPEIISKLKHAAFKWAPSQTAWQRQLTQNAKWATEKLIKEISGSEIKLP